MTELVEVRCPLCGMLITPAQAKDVEEDMEFESKSCPVCCRTYAEARREECGDYTLSPKDVAELRELVSACLRGRYLTIAERERAEALFAFASQSLERDAEIRLAAIEECAKVIDRRCADVLSKQTGARYPDFGEQVDTNLRMVAVLLPDLSEAIRALAQQPPAKEGM